MASAFTENIVVHIRIHSFILAIKVVFISTESKLRVKEREIFNQNFSRTPS